MADRLDVAERLAEGRAAIEHTQVYVRACQTLGYEHPDLTSHPSQIRDWLDSEDGLDLRVLDRDCAELRAAGAAAAEGLRIQHAQVADLTAAWTGPEATPRLRFCNAIAMPPTWLPPKCGRPRSGVNRCATTCGICSTRRSATAIAIDDRSLAQRSAWLAAAAVVTAGAGERSTAQEVVHEQMTPYVDNDIRNDWLTAMRSSLAAFGTSYDMVNDRMAAAPAAYFEFPGDLGPGFPPSQPPPPSAPTLSSAPAVTAARRRASQRCGGSRTCAGGSRTGSDTGPAPRRHRCRTWGPRWVMLRPYQREPSGLWRDLGISVGEPGGLGGLGGLANRIVDAMSGLLGSAADGVGDPAGLDDSVGNDPFDEDSSDEDTSDEDPFDPDDEHDDADKERDDPDDKHDAKVEEAQPVNAPPPADTSPLPVDGPPPANVPAPVATPAPAAVPAPPAAPPTDGSTPCEIAADQVPQAGQ